jgi:hypothetical protein
MIKRFNDYNKTIMTECRALLQLLNQQPPQLNLGKGFNYIAQYFLIKISVLVISLVKIASGITNPSYNKQICSEVFVITEFDCTSF